MAGGERQHRAAGQLSRFRSVVSSALLLSLVAVAGCGPAATPRSEPSTNAAGVVIWTRPDDTTYNGAEPLPPYQMPDLSLTETDGSAFNLRTDTTHAVTLVFFGYTHCPDVCPLVMSDLTSAVVSLPDDVQAQTQLIFISTDPTRDTPGVLRSYLDRYDSSFVGLTGELIDVKAAGAALGVPIGRTRRLPSGGYDVSHGAQVVGFRGDVAPVVWTEGTPVPDLVADITRLATS